MPNSSWNMTADDCAQLSDIVTQLQTVIPNVTITETEWEEAEAETPPYQLWFIIACAVFFAVTLAYGIRRNRRGQSSSRTLRQLNVAQSHYSGFLASHLIREALIAAGYANQADRILHILTIPANMGFAMGTGFPFSPLVAGSGAEGEAVLGTLPGYSSSGFNQVQAAIFLKTIAQTLTAILSYVSFNRQAPSTVYPALVIGEFLHMIIARIINERPASMPWEHEPAEMQSRLTSRRSNLLYGMPGAVLSTFIVGGMWQGFDEQPGDEYWGHNHDLARGVLGIGWNALTMVAVEEIIYIGWVAMQYLRYGRIRCNAERPPARRSSARVEEVNDPIEPAPNNADLEMGVMGNDESDSQSHYTISNTNSPDDRI